MKNKMIRMTAAALLLALSLTGCGTAASGSASSGASTDSLQTIKIGVTAISQITYEAIESRFADKGYQTEFVMFDSNPVVLEACAAGEVDMALGQHARYVQTYNENNGSDLTMVKPYGYYTGIGLYSEKYTAIDEIPDGAQIAIMNDAQNMSIALMILRDAGLIELDESVDTYTTADITANPKNLQIIDMDQAQTVAALTDMDAACVFFTHMSNAGKDPASYIVRDSVMINYPMGAIVRGEDAQSDWAVAYAECFKEQSVRDAIDEQLPGVFAFYESDDQVTFDY
ncbi:methionine-binding protein [Oscillibacter hominis]|uniref:Methionine-binding protein n=1 Tax=Oscillibacter hominis TaxID=2763056 RepID=A0A7G9B497_9FIRM|nr:MetQ/NlpA family ABC transporter substrate-binding protein [Oscillibacter hominis]QNL44378.1 methionine-binding protein [Oscillibacter hominis]